MRIHILAISLICLLQLAVTEQVSRVSNYRYQQKDYNYTPQPSTSHGRMLRREYNKYYRCPYQGGGYSYRSYESLPYYCRNRRPQRQSWADWMKDKVEYWDNLWSSFDSTVHSWTTDAKQMIQQQNQTDVNLKNSNQALLNAWKQANATAAMINDKLSPVVAKFQAGLKNIQEIQASAGKKVRDTLKNNEFMKKLRGNMKGLVKDVRRAPKVFMKKADKTVIEASNAMQKVHNIREESRQNVKYTWDKLVGETAQQIGSMKDEIHRNWSESPRQDKQEMPLSDETNVKEIAKQLLDFMKKQGNA